MDFLFDPDSQNDLKNAGPCGTMARDFTVMPVGSAGATDITMIPRSEWSDRIKSMESEKSRLSDLLTYYKVPCLNQQQTSFCHANSPTLAIMALRAAQGQPFVLLSPASVANPITGYQNEGAFIHDDLKQITNVGCASQAYVPANCVGRQCFKSGWEDDAAKHKVTEWYDLGAKNNTMFDRMGSLLLQRIPVCVAYNWWGHAVTAIDLVMFDDGSFGVRFRNSWGDAWPNQGSGGYALLRETKATADEAYAPRSVILSV